MTSTQGKSQSLLKSPNLFQMNKKNTNHLISNSQQISSVLSKEDSVMHKQNNFILANKRNLKNFFKDRLPKDNIVVGDQPMTIPPKRIFQLRKQQSVKQQGTKMTLSKSFQFQSITKSYSTKKMNQTFQVNSKTKQVSKILPSRTQFLKIQTSLSSYQTPTSSSIVKRSQTAKKQAYISVFGDKLVEEKSRMLEIQCGNEIYASRIVRNKNKKIKSKININKQVIASEKERLVSLLDKLENFAKQVNPYRFDFFKQQKQAANQNPEGQEQKRKRTQQTEIYSWVKSISDGYNKRNIEMKIHRIKTLEDLEKLDPNFYQKMSQHKKDRLWVRNKALNGLKKQSQYTIYDNFNESRIQRKQEKLQKDQIQGMITITQRLNASIQPVEQTARKQTISFTRRGSYRQKISNFCKKLIHFTNLAKLFGINSQNIYSALMKTRKPYQLQGSYAFFKLIKSGQLQKVKAFVNKNVQFVFQIDHQYRTPLIYATQCDKYEIAKFLISAGSNIDGKAQNGNTALFCAIKKDNYQVVQSLLKAGASPWSTKYYNVGKLLDNCDQRIGVAIKNARKIHVIRSLFYDPKARNQFWKENSQKYINGYEILKFN